MNARPTKCSRSGCPISIALEAIGDPWSLLVVRDLMFKGLRTFNEFLCSGEGIATNILSDRLARLETHGIIDKRRDAADARRFVYRLTEKGIDLTPMLVEMVLWATEHYQTDAPAKLVRQMRTNREEFIAQVRSQWLASQQESP
jgi:DNA-binding HxlR family transcriptional regulator